MDCRRRNSRIKCDSHCVLRAIDGSNYMARLGDISLDGALVKVRNSIPHDLKVGDVCDLMFGYGYNDFSLKHPCRIVRHDLGDLGVSFIGR